MPSQTYDNAKKYLANDVALEKIDPHAVYPTSIYRTCDGVTLATKDSQTIEAVCSTHVTTTIKITRGILNHDNRILAEIYKPLGRVISLVDDKVEELYGKELEAYFAAHEIPMIKLVHPGNEANKDMKNVENILLDLKQNGVSRQEPLLIVGGGVIADIGGFATALYHRNCPYVMLCTSIVTGIDAGPSPRTCCDGYGFKNLYGAYHPPVYTITDRYFWKSLHEGWIRHGIAEIIKMAAVQDLPLFELLEKAGHRLVSTKFGTSDDCQDDKEFQDLCDAIVGRGMESYVKDEYGNLWETHQARPHAFGHTWSPGYELPAGMLHGHSVTTCMGFGSFLSYKRNWLTLEQFKRIMNIMSVMELAVWHPIMDNHGLVIGANKKAYQKRGGNLCAPNPKD
jgi:3-dehydroquinate synthase